MQNAIKRLGAMSFAQVQRLLAAATIVLVIVSGPGCPAQHAPSGTAAPTPTPTPRPPAARPLGYSGMARFGQAAFLVVHDSKVPSHDPRVSVLKVGTPETGPSLSKVEADWGTNEPANDLESACAVPGTTDEFL